MDVLMLISSVKSAVDVAVPEVETVAVVEVEVDTLTPLNPAMPIIPAVMVRTKALKEHRMEDDLVVGLTAVDVAVDAVNNAIDWWGHLPYLFS